MLKSTYKPPAGHPPLPEGWTQHKAPNGKKAEPMKYLFADIYKATRTTTTILPNNPLIFDLSSSSSYSQPMDLSARLWASITTLTLRSTQQPSTEVPLTLDVLATIHLDGWIIPADGAETQEARRDLSPKIDQRESLLYMITHHGSLCRRSSADASYIILKVMRAFGNFLLT